MCSQDCAFCSQSAHFDTHVKGETIVAADEIYRACREAVSSGARCFGIVNSGLAPSDAEIEALAPVIRRLRADGDVMVAASLGILSEKQARRLAEIGVQRYNHNLQTSRRYYPSIVGTHSYDDRLETLRHLKAAGIEVCCGALFGMGETWSDRIELALQLRELNPNVVPVNFLIPIAGTPLEGTEPLEVGECLKIIALLRYLLPRQNQIIAGGRDTRLGEAQQRIFDAGASGFLIGNYLTTCGRPPETDHQMLRDLGLKMSRYQEPDDQLRRSGGTSLPVLGPGPTRPGCKV
jgi:biotin synthase